MENNKQSKATILEVDGMAIHDTVEIISSGNQSLYGVTGTITDFRKGKFGSDARVKTTDGREIWIDTKDLVLY